jgi:hypothetical protein
LDGLPALTLHVIPAARFQQDAALLLRRSPKRNCFEPSSFANERRADRQGYFGNPLKLFAVRCADSRPLTGRSPPAWRFDPISNGGA